MSRRRNPKEKRLKRHLRYYYPSALPRRLRRSFLRLSQPPSSVQRTQAERRGAVGHRLAFGQDRIELA